MDYGMVYGCAAQQQGATENPATANPISNTPQHTLNEFWESLICEKPGKVTTIFPRYLYAKSLSRTNATTASFSQGNAAAGYEAAAAECRAKVARIVKECHRTNEKFTDPDFDIEGDFAIQNCLYPLDTVDNSANNEAAPIGAEVLRNALSSIASSNILGNSPALTLDLACLRHAIAGTSSENGGPACVHRLDYIFNDPAFTVDGFSTSDVQQGQTDDCWWVAAVATLCSKPGLMEKVCVARDAECGVYGFVFYRDGEWITTVVDDLLYLSNKDSDADFDDYDATGEKARIYKERYQTGSEALYFSKCDRPNETWLPLLEKAYAKVHGDYNAISGGHSGEAVEDMTGGVTTTLNTTKILSKEKLWREMINSDQEFIFAASAPAKGVDESRQGLALNHAYSVLKAVEVVGENDKKMKLVLIRNPWGKRAYTGMGEWNGPWSDGSKEWTPYWMQKLDHRFGDDGEFWMSFDDFRQKFSKVHRTRLFDKKWAIVQQWTSTHVSWIPGFVKTKFCFEIKKEGPIVIVLSQLDTRYFKGLEGQYTFDLEFILQEPDSPLSDYVVQARCPRGGERSVSSEVDLKPGKYFVLPKISAHRNTSKPKVESVVKFAAENNPQKLRQIGMNYDISHAKGGFAEEEAEQKKRETAKRVVAEQARVEQERKRMEQEAAWQQAQRDAYVQGQREGFARAQEAYSQSQVQQAAQAHAQAQLQPQAQTTIGLDGQQSSAPAQEFQAPIEAQNKNVPASEFQTEGSAAPKRNSQLRELQLAPTIPAIKTEDEDANSEKKEAVDVDQSSAEKSETTHEKTEEVTPALTKETQIATTNNASNVTSELAYSSFQEAVSLSDQKPPQNSEVTHQPPEQNAEDLEGSTRQATHGKDHARDADEDDEPVPKTIAEVAGAWNAVVVIGLRIYSKDPDVVISLIKPKTREGDVSVNANGQAEVVATV